MFRRMLNCTAAVFYAEGRKCRVIMRGHFDSIEEMCVAIQMGQPSRLTLYCD